MATITNRRRHMAQTDNMKHQVHLFAMTMSACHWRQWHRISIINYIFILQSKGLACSSI